MGYVTSQAYRWSEGHQGCKKQRELAYNNRKDNNILYSASSVKQK